jgi:ATP-binding protein involved in chromosome partitioning
LVTTPQEVSLQDVRKAYAMFERVRVPVLGFVENMSWFVCDGCDKRHFIFGEGGGERLAKKFGAELLARLPIRPEVRKGGDEGAPVMMEEIRALARGLEGRLAKLEGTGLEIGNFS